MYIVLSSRKAKGMKKNKLKEFKHFIWDTIDDILGVSDLPVQDIRISFKTDECCSDDDKHHTISASINVLPMYQSFALIIYKDVFEHWLGHDFNFIKSVLCHEIGHVHTAKLVELAESSFKTEKEVTDADEQLTTKIGRYLAERLRGTKDWKNSNKKTKKR